MAWTYVIDDATLPEGTMAPVYPAGVNVVTYDVKVESGWVWVAKRKGV